MIEVRELVKNHGPLRVLDGVSLSVRRGEVAVLIGPSGGGKSTLLRCINGLETFQQGEVRVDEIVLRPGADRAKRNGLLPQLRRRVGMVFQQFHLFPHLRVLENVLSGPLWVLGQPRGRSGRRWLGNCWVAWVWPTRSTPGRSNLSGGQQQRVAIARALAMKPEAILFDEPTSALDPRMAAEVLRVIADLAESGQTMVVVTHAMGFARRVAHTVHVMHEGRIAESGPPEQIFGQPRLDVTRSFLAQVTAD